MPAAVEAEVAVLGRGVGGGSGGSRGGGAGHDGEKRDSDGEGAHKAPAGQGVSRRL